MNFAVYICMYLCTRSSQLLVLTYTRACVFSFVRQVLPTGWASRTVLCSLLLLRDPLKRGHGKSSQAKVRPPTSLSCFSCAFTYSSIGRRARRGLVSNVLYILSRSFLTQRQREGFQPTISSLCVEHVFTKFR